MRENALHDVAVPHSWWNLEHLISATLRLRNTALVIHVLIDTGCLQTNIIYTRVADLLNVDGELNIRWTFSKRLEWEDDRIVFRAQ